MPPLPRSSPEERNKNRDDRNSPTPHKLEHISEVIRREYPDAVTDRSNKPKRRWRIPNLINQTTGTFLACIIFVVATPIAIYLLANDQLLHGLALLTMALGAAFAPKVYADFFQPKRGNGSADDQPQSFTD